MLLGVTGLLVVGAASAQAPDRLANHPPTNQSAVRAQVASRAADFAATAPTPDARRLAHWVALTGDNQGLVFFLIDKVHATLYLFDGKARLLASTPVLLGAAIGDDSVPGIGTRPMEQIRPFERTTPAGRYLAESGRNLQGEDIVWIDHDAAVSMHRVRATNPLERRIRRLATATPADNRISYGCVNLPTAFYNQHVQPVFAASRTAVVYVLPETRSLQAQFGLVVASGATGLRPPLNTARTQQARRERP